MALWAECAVCIAAENPGLRHLRDSGLGIAADLALIGEGLGVGVCAQCDPESLCTALHGRGDLLPRDRRVRRKGRFPGSVYDPFSAAHAI